MAKVSWNKTWSDKMRVKNRGKKGKNRKGKKKARCELSRFFTAGGRVSVFF
jgi:hypothetical protein